jgi:hypothetical protein
MRPAACISWRHGRAVARHRWKPLRTLARLVCVDRYSRHMFAHVSFPADEDVWLPCVLPGPRVAVVPGRAGAFK